MKIAFLAPAGAMHRYNGLFHKNLHYAPITLALLAALVPHELEAELVIHDETAGPIPLDLNADVVAITCITGTAERSYRFADYFRSRGMCVILGGVHPSLLPDEAKMHADCVITGLAEKSFPKALLDWRAGQLQPFYHQPPDASIADRPLPRKDLLRQDRYITLNTVEAVRGCCHTCSFCAYPSAFGKGIYKRPVADIIGEIKTFKGKFVVFPDVNLITDLEFARELFTAMIPLKKWWLGLTTAAIGHDDDLLALFRKSGCKGLLIGFESINQEAQSSIHKGVNKVSEYRALMDGLHRHGIMVMGCFAFGSDGDSRDVFERTVQFCQAAKIDLPRFSVITPFPQTPFHAELEEQGRITDRHWALYDVEHVVFTPSQMSQKALEEGIDWAWKRVYSIRSILGRIDWRNVFRINVLYLVYLLSNIGYRRYAQHFSIFDAARMLDNSDIPAVVHQYEPATTP
jgi:radical SAM superfamily enzyme YgiQ (UPF0313 family)